MNVFTSIAELSSLPGPVHLAIGVFDGVHIGHQAVIQAALQTPGTPVVVTFDPHPMQVLQPERSPLRLTSRRHQQLLLQRLGVPHLLVIPFDEAMARQSAQAFAQTLQTACRPLGSIAVGEDWTFGYRAQGNVALLRELGITVQAVPSVQVEGTVVRSTLIREAVRDGRLREAARALGRRYSVLGLVTEGRQLARQWGFPTANLIPEQQVLPPDGVYAIYARHENHVYPGVANLGRRPTIETNSLVRRLEAHLFDFSGNLYGHELEVEWVTQLRPEQTFPNVEALREQIERDVAMARACLAPPEKAFSCTEK